ncbi:RNI-like superfamily protein [Arabidopsis thaliana]|uniref:RNI-like superfamily protein n=1 Tax=Arabidopsis thaliana TaxID=3702 RepID=A0A1P8B9I9_ARATH|nr:RNI-like superfamily protein [Arabidopsis thaliana]ANM68261.1 RNI-like superfamily protein [Arabidopsis thaliana]|eukprot:NP_001330029.1 RNI-like superfamily protein [Arabidopsis thaliana]
MDSGTQPEGLQAAQPAGLQAAGLQAAQPAGLQAAGKRKPPTTTEDPNDPQHIIHDFLTIVNKLEKEVDLPGAITRARTYDAEVDGLITADQPQTNLGRAESAPIPNAKPEGPDDHHIPKLQRNLRLLKEDVAKLQYLRSEVAEEVWKHIRPLELLLENVAKEQKKNPTKPPLTLGMKKDLDDINKKIFNLMCQVPLLPNKRKKAKGLDDDDGDGDNNNGKGIVCLPGIHANKADLRSRAVFRYVLREFEELSDQRKICLLTFAVFPENQEVNRTMLMYWWMGEGILSTKDISSQEGTEEVILKPEDVVKVILKDFTDRNLIEPVEIKRKVEPSSYKMAPFVHASVVLISKEIGLFDMYDIKDKPVMKKSGMHKVCLVEGSSSQQEAKAKKMEDVDHIETVFNVSERFPDFTFKWFSEDKPTRNKLTLSKVTYQKLKVFYLGRWERTAKRHIEVENPELMKNLKRMIKLKLLSFQGISRIERLDDAVCKLRDLIILDLRACYNLEKLPDKIDSLKALIYLDITDCYMIDRMPKRLSWLDNLEVLKGFVVSDATDEETVCTLAELVHLKKLRKLSISINKENFSIDDVFVAVKSFKKLEKLKVAWGGINTHPQGKGVDSEKGDENVKPKENIGILERAATMFRKEKDPTAPELPKTLKKLDLQCFPGEHLPEWLEPDNLLNVEKLYIKGGIKLTGFGKSLPSQNSKCKVTVLRLKFLPKLKVEWRDLSKRYFPELKFLEKYQCPQVSLCPCDGIGIWRKPEEDEV